MINADSVHLCSGQDERPVEHALLQRDASVPLQLHLCKNTHSTEMCSGSEAGSYLRLIDSCITQLKAQGPFTTCTESRAEEEEDLLNMHCCSATRACHSSS